VSQAMERGRGDPAGRSYEGAGAMLALCLCLTASVAAQEVREGPAVGDTVPKFTLFDADGRQLRLRDIKEPVIVLNLWAFWCDTWIAQLPQLRELAAQQDLLNFRLLAISVDGMWTDQLKAVCGSEGAPFPLLIDRRKRLSRQLRLRRVPTIIVLNRERKITYVHEAYPGNLGVLQAIREAASAKAAPDGTD